ncbi:MAG: alpha/beta fold hydrolase [Burkholderiaceae bacterium]|nr:alpha/beta fold hydrolase [Burkholderiaceae bacterium]
MPRDNDIAQPLPNWPAAVTTLADVAAIDALAARAKTPCGEGDMVWRIWGLPDARPPLLLLHGGSGSWTHWVRNLAALVATGRQVFVPDLPGFGESATPPSGGDADALPPILETGIARLVGDRPIDVVGFSFGALTGGLWAADHPDRISHLVLSGAPSLSTQTLPALDLRPWTSAPAGPERDAIHRHNLLALMLAREDSVDALAIALHGANLLCDRMRSRRISRTDILRQKLPAYRCALSGIWGAEDILYRHRRPVVGEALARAPRFRSLAMIPGAGHWVAYEAHAEFDRALLRALDDDRDRTD